MINFFKKQKISPLVITRYLIIYELIAILFSPALSNLFELVLFAFCITSKEIRTTIWNSKSQPLFVSSIAFILTLAISTTWSVAPLTEALNSLWGWRKILLLPISLVLFQEAIWKERALKGFISFSIAACVASYIMFLLNHSVHGWEAGVLVRNHATQGMIFSIAAFVIFTKLAITPTKLEKPKIAILALGILMLVINVSFITPGRSGYLVLLTLTIVSFVSYAMTHKKINTAIILVALLIPTLIFISPKVHEGVSMGLNEMQNVDEIAKPTSMGQRVKLWGNTIEMIKEKPLVGVGLGGFEKAYSEKMKNAPDWQKVILHDPHNQFLKIIAELGLIGLMSFLYMLATAALQRPSSREYRTLGLGVLLAWCGTSMFSSHFSTFTEGRFIFIWLGFMLASHASEKSNQ
jgi:O-antigen ligase